MQCSNPQCWDHVSGPNTLRAGSTSCSPRATLEANSWISDCIVVSYFCSGHIIDICIGVMHWVTSCIVKSRPLCSIPSQGLTLVMYLQLQPHCLECTWFQNHIAVLQAIPFCSLGGTSGKKKIKWAFLETDGLIYIPSAIQVVVVF